jgi:DNA-binding response OmpR family regulator
MVAGDHRVVLVADDDPALRLLCRVNLEADGYQVAEADCADDVERLVSSRDVALVLLDIHLGADDGVAVAEKLRADHPSVRIALFSGSALHLPRAVRELADAVLSKPFSLEELSATARRLASR